MASMQWVQRPEPGSVTGRAYAVAEVSTDKYRSSKNGRKGNGEAVLMNNRNC
jgi:hypothetical protein